MRLGRRLRQLTQLPPGALGRRVTQRAGQMAQRLRHRLPGPLADWAFRRALAPGLRAEAALVQRLQHGPFPAFFIDDRAKAATAEAFRTLCPEDVAPLLRAADQARRQTFDLLGSGPYTFPAAIDWHLDFKSGHRFDPQADYHAVRHAPYPGGYDIIVPWELSRCQHFVWLGQAYWLTGDEAYARAFVDQVEQWLAANPPQRGVNWACTMDVGLRAVSWLWGYAFFRHSPSLSPAFHVRLYRALHTHAGHIRYNLEHTHPNNHYLADLVGLIYLGCLLPEFRAAPSWRAFGLRELEAEMFQQVYADGVSFEGATNYHRLATELFLSATWLAQLHGHQFSPAYLQRLEQMLAALGQIARPDGTTPVLGDQDNGRVQRLKVWADPAQEWVDCRSLLAAGALWSGRPPTGAVGPGDWAEAFWLAGPDAVRAAPRTTPAGTDPTVLREGGWAVLRAPERYLLLEAGPVGQHGLGGHGHNDALSLEVFADGQAWIVDPGAYVYTADYATRQALRQTQAHNTVYVPGQEQSPLAPHSLFRMEAPSHCGVRHWAATEAYTLVIAEVQSAAPATLTHHRAVLYVAAERAWLVADYVHPLPAAARLHWTFAPGVLAEAGPGASLRLSNAAGQSLLLWSEAGGPATLSPAWVSAGYGTRQPSLQAELAFAGDPVHFWALLPETSPAAAPALYRTLRRAWDELPPAARLRLTA